MLLKVMNTTPCKKIKDSTMQKKIVSVIIPTLQKNKTILTNLIHSLDKDGAVSEIILIDNSCKRFSHPSDKLKVIIFREDCYTYRAIFSFLKNRYFYRKFLRTL